MKKTKKLIKMLWKKKRENRSLDKKKEEVKVRLRESDD